MDEHHEIYSKHSDATCLIPGISFPGTIVLSTSITVPVLIITDWMPIKIFVY